MAMILSATFSSSFIAESAGGSEVEAGFPAAMQTQVVANTAPSDKMLIDVSFSFIIE